MGVRSDETTDAPVNEQCANLISWSWVASSSRRENAFEGLLVGCAIGESFGLAREGFSRRQGLKIFGGPPVRFNFVPGFGFPGERTHSVLMTTQAMLESRADHRTFAKKLRKRRRWYLISAPFRWLARATQPRIQFKSGALPMPNSLAGDPLIRAAIISQMIQGSQNAEPWVKASTALTCRSKDAVEPGVLVAQAMQLAQMRDPLDKPFSSTDALQSMIAETIDKDLLALLEKIRPCLEKNYSVSRTAKAMGWGNGIPQDLRAIAIMGVYAWLRHPYRFRFAVERAVLLGGASASVGAIAGALSGATLGKRGIPSQWAKRVSLFPHNKTWVDGLIDRIKDWPHGVEDIQNAHAEQTFILGQLGRNVIYSIFRLIHLLIRIPAKLVP